MCEPPSTVRDPVGHGHLCSGSHTTRLLQSHRHERPGPKPRGGLTHKLGVTPRSSGCVTSPFEFLAHNAAHLWCKIKTMMASCTWDYLG